MSSGHPELVLVVPLAIVVSAGLGYYFLKSPAPDTDTELVAGQSPAAHVSTAPEFEPASIDARTPPAESETLLGVVPPAVPALAMPRFRVTSDVVGADVFIDRKFVGKTPFESFHVSLGFHRVNVSAPGYEGFVYDVVIGEGLTSLDAAFTVLMLDQRIAVVHKHDQGECEGELVADLDGIRYRTAGEDGFSVELDGFDEFRVDYLAHTLHLTVRGGRAYDFTDREANADTLFIFHREVEKVRERSMVSNDPEPK